MYSSRLIYDMFFDFNSFLVLVDLLTIYWDNFWLLW